MDLKPTEKAMSLGMAIPTRESLLSRLKDASQDESWREFFETYWRLIYDNARKNDLSDDEAQDVVQETMIALTQNIKTFRYDRARGSFKAWLMQLTQWKIVDQFRKREIGRPLDEFTEGKVAANLSEEWDKDWQINIAEEAMRRVKTTASPKMFQAFHTNVIQGRGPRETATLLRMSIPAVHMAKYKINRLLRKEAEKLEKAEFQS